ncbi:hypothetical protein C7444_102194, partial [Sphaerotilus hippei]
MKMFRLDRTDAHLGNPCQHRDTRRAPSNVPYLVDNLWEWCRPMPMPSRRHSVFACPTPELAREAGNATAGSVFSVETTEARVVQIAVKDAKFHPEADPANRNNLSRVVARMFDQKWFDLPIAERGQEALLWSPCLERGEIDRIIGLSRHLRPRREELRNAVRFWQDATLVKKRTVWPHAEGEIFFTA